MQAKNCTTHRLRKAAARRLAEAGNPQTTNDFYVAAKPSFKIAPAEAWRSQSVFSRNSKRGASSFIA
jgi:hypothetical protein